MVTIENIIKFTLTKDEVKVCIQKAKDNFDIAQLDNLRNRHRNIQFDCMIRGYVGEYAILKWAQSHNIFFETTNLLVEDDNMDIDFFYKGKNIELKTSLIPDVDETIERAIQVRDIKLIKRTKNIEDLKGDVHLQIYYQQNRKAKDTWLEQQNVDLTSDDIEYLYDSLNARAYLNTTYFVAWIDKPTLVAAINAKPASQRVWAFARREFWLCPIRTSKPPLELITYLNNL